MQYEAHVIEAERNLQRALGHSWTQQQAAEMMRAAGEARHDRLRIRRDTFLPLSSAARSVGDRVAIPSGMGGLFDVKLLAKQTDGCWQVRIDMPRNPDWHAYLIDDVREDAMRSAHPMTA